MSPFSIKRNLRFHSNATYFGIDQGDLNNLFLPFVVNENVVSISSWLLFSSRKRKSRNLISCGLTQPSRCNFSYEKIVQQLQISFLIKSDSEFPEEFFNKFFFTQRPLWRPEINKIFNFRRNIRNIFTQPWFVYFILLFWNLNNSIYFIKILQNPKHPSKFKGKII